MPNDARHTLSRADRRRNELAKSRLSNLRAALKKLGASHAIISNPTDVGYLTGFLGGDSILIAGSGKPTIISDSRYLEELEPFKPIAKIVMRIGPIIDAAASVLGSLRDAGRLDGIAVQSDHMTLAEESALRTACKKRRIPVRSIRPTPGLVNELRCCKDKAEIGLIRAALDLQQEALLEAFENFKAGMTELEFAAELEYQMKSRGSIEPAFGTIVAAGPSGSHPHYRPADIPIKRGSTLLIDWGATWQGYRGDMTRTLGVGRWPREMREAYKVVLDAHEAAASAIKPGVTGAQLDTIARDVITDAGYGKAFVHSLGHGVGMDVHESPRLSSQSGDVLEAGHVVTIEPGIYLPGIGGIRIEDVYAVTARGSKNLCTLPKDIGWATL